jgi:hypothetical protein
MCVKNRYTWKSLKASYWFFRYSVQLAVIRICEFASGVSRTVSFWGQKRGLRQL